LSSLDIVILSESKDIAHEETMTVGFMRSTKQIKQRIKSVKNTAQITKAMEVVSATKMRKSQEFAIRARPYAVASLEMLKNLLSRTPILPPLLTQREIKKSALLVVTSDKGLAGAFNANILKKAEAWVQHKKMKRASYILIAVGKKARDYFERRGEPIHPVRSQSRHDVGTADPQADRTSNGVQESFVGFGDYSTLKETLPVAQTVLQEFLLGIFDEVEAVYTNFRSTLRQEAVVKKILPVTEQGIEEIVEGILPERGKYTEAGITNHESRIRYNYEYKFEPSASEILEALVPQLIRMHIHHIILESNASEHSARMIAMKNASDSAKEIINDLTLSFNKARQSSITQELTEITAGKEALENL